MTHNVLRTVRTFKVGSDTRREISWELVSERKPYVRPAPTAAQVLSKIKPEPNKNWTLASKPRLVGKAREWSVESLHTFCVKHNGL